VCLAWADIRTPGLPGCAKQGRHPADRREKSPLQPRFGFFLVAVALRYVLSKKLDDTKTVVSSSLHSLNIEFGAARVAALPRAAWSSGCSWPSVSGATLSAAHAANLKPSRASWGENARAHLRRALGSPRTQQANQAR
jgi:hypothetical protein